MSREANSKDQLSKISGPGSACIRNNQGYIECGPIVGYPPPQSNPVENPFVPAMPDQPVMPKTPSPFIESPDGSKEFPMIGKPPLGVPEFRKLNPDWPSEKKIPFTKIDPNLREHIERQLRRYNGQGFAPGANVIMDAQKPKK
jgi:hypothetical protein